MIVYMYVGMHVCMDMCFLNSSVKVAYSCALENAVSRHTADAPLDIDCYYLGICLKECSCFHVPPTWLISNLGTVWKCVFLMEVLCFC